MFGSITEAESLVLTHADLFQYISAVLGEFPWDDELLSALRKANYFIFLGFQFERWYVQFMLRLIMKASEDPSSFVFRKKDETHSVYNVLAKEFDIEFIGDQDNVKSFIDELHKRCSEKNILREVMAEEVNLASQIRNLVEQNDLKNAMEMLKEHFEEENDRDNANMMISLKGDLKKVSMKRKAGAISEEDESVELANLKLTVLSILDEDVVEA